MSFGIPLSKSRQWILKSILICVPSPTREKLANIIEMKDGFLRNFLEENEYDILHQR